MSSLHSTLVIAVVAIAALLCANFVLKIFFAVRTLSFVPSNLIVGFEIECFLGIFQVARLLGSTPTALSPQLSSPSTQVQVNWGISTPNLTVSGASLACGASFKHINQCTGSTGPQSCRRCSGGKLYPYFGSQMRTRSRS